MGMLDMKIDLKPLFKAIKFNFTKDGDPRGDPSPVRRGSSGTGWIDDPPAESTRDKPVITTTDATAGRPARKKS
jgi:hypothetical protein